MDKLENNINFVKRAIAQYIKTNNRRPGLMMISSEQYANVVHELTAGGVSVSFPIQVDGVQVEFDHTLESGSSVCLDSRE